MNVDMSAKAVTLRLKRASQLRKLTLSLGKAKFPTPSSLNLSEVQPGKPEAAAESGDFRSLVDAAVGQGKPTAWKAPGRKTQTIRE